MEGYPHAEVYACLTDVFKCKWTLEILDAITQGINRPGRLERALPGLTQKVLQERIRKLERYGIIERVAYPVIPPHVEYRFTERGERLIELLRAIRQFAERWDQAKFTSLHTSPANDG
ncbi:MAG: transcriptional regulator [Armatimonadota bacterium]